MRRIVLAGGGSAGAMSPLIGVANSIKDTDCLFLVTHSGPETKVLHEYGLRFIAIRSGKWRRYFSLKNIYDFSQILIAFFQARKILKQFRPQLVLTSGSFNAVPVAYAAKTLGIPVIVHQQDLQLGLANRLMAPIAHTITVSLQETQGLFQSYKAKILLTGNPLRRLEVVKTEEDTILILGGSQGARGLNEMVKPLIPLWTEKYRVVHILGKSNMDQALPDLKNYVAKAFVTEEMSALLNAAKIVITRAGMSTLTELAHFSKATVVIPMPNSHQERNSQYFSSKMAVRSVAQGSVTTLDSFIRALMEDSEKIKGLAKNLHNCFPAHANKNYCKFIDTLAIPRSRSESVVYFAGIGGIGVSALARYFKNEGYKVVGSDIVPSDLTRKLEAEGIVVHYGQGKQNIDHDYSRVIYSDALPSTNPELVQSKKFYLPLYTYSEYLGLLSRTYKTIAISGTHGKTTTTAMTGLTLQHGNLDPTVLVGSIVPQWQSNFRAGQSNLMVVEADEYRSHMLHIRPSIAVITNIDDDHLDYYKNIQHIEEEFQKFVHTLPQDGYLIVNADDKRAIQLKSKARIITFGLTSEANFRATNIKYDNLHTSFDVSHDGTLYGQYTLQIPGNFNVANALAVIVIGHILNIPHTIVMESLANYQGSWRRFEYIGTLGTTPCYSDYAHHPTEVAVTLQAAKLRFPDKEIITVFQPHSIERTESHFDKFAAVLGTSDSLIVTDSFHVAGRDEKRKADPARKLLYKINLKNKLFSRLQDLEPLLRSQLHDNSVVMFLGAGSIDSWARSVTKKK